jgi:rRNA-processing protein EBP2
LTAFLCTDANHIIERASAPTTAETEPDLFDVELDDTTTPNKKDRDFKRNSRGGSGGRGDRSGPNKRQKKDEKFGFGGKKRFGKSTDAASSADASGFSVAKMKGKTGGRGGRGGARGGASSRPGKSRRAAGRP